MPIAKIGVMPMPPAISTPPTSGTSLKWFFGADTVKLSPTCSDSCNERDPPRDAGSSFTPITR
ncbi:hypothetical protein D3C86_2169500 [compost metagenome]